MKNKIYIRYAFFVLLVISSLQIQAQRNVIWAHGLNGDKTHWNHYEAVFNSERQINSVNETYHTSSGIDWATNSLQFRINDKLNPNQQQDSQNLGMGHSLGGLVLRNSDRRNLGRIGGFITVNTPNFGAPIVNSLQNGDALRVAQNGGDKLLKGPISQILPIPFSIIGNFFSDDLANAFINQDLFDSFGVNNISVNDLKPNSTILNSINNFHSNLPRISIWSQENSPTHWKLLSEFMFDDDTTLSDYANTTRGIYNAFYVLNTSLAIACGIGGWWNPWCWAATANYIYKAVQWKKGRNWIDNSENLWNSLIKTTRQEAQTYWVNEWIPCNYQRQIINRPIEPGPNCGEWRWVQKTRYVSVNYPSDGLLPKYTQIMKNNNTPNNVYQIDGANHMEVLDMSSSPQGDLTYKRLKNIFNRRDWFQTN